MLMFCPFIEKDCRREECQLWVEDAEALGCALFFMGLEALTKFRETRPLEASS